MKRNWPVAWRTSARLVGWLPLMGSTAAVALLLALNATIWRGEREPLLPAVRVVETIVPLVIGLHAAFLLSPEDERPLELLLASPRPSFWILLERLLVVAVLQGGVALIGSLAGLVLAGGEGMALTIVRWLAPSVFFGGVALFMTQLSRKGVFSALLTALLWGGLLLASEALPTEFFFLVPMHPYLQPGSVASADYVHNRISLALAGAVLTALALYLACNEERLLGVHGQSKSDRRSYLWLAMAAALLVLSNGTRIVPLAAWLAPVFMVRFLRKQTIDSPGVFLGHLAMVGVVYVAWKDVVLTPFSLNFGYYVFALFYGLYLFLPYLADRLVAPRLNGFASTLMLPLAWVTLEFLHGLLSPTAMHGAIAYTQYGHLSLLQVMAVTGMYGVTFLVTWFASVVNWAWEREFAWPRIRNGAGVYAVILALVLLLGGARLALFPSQSDTVRVVAFTETDNEAYLERSEREARAGAQVVVWPEAGAVVAEEDEAVFIARGREIARQEEIYLAMAMGTVPSDFPQQFVENKVILIDPLGKVAWEYLKSRPVPGFERSVRGDGHLPLLDTPYGRISAAICYDMDFPNLIRQAGAAGVDLLLAPSNDMATEPDPFHAQIATFRAIENGFSLVRPNGQGTSMTVDYQGRVLAAMDSSTTTNRLMIAHVPTKGATAVYAHIGDVFAWLCVAGFVALLALAVAQRHTR